MKINFSKLTLASAAMAVAVLASLPAMAEKTILKVPFSFTVNGQQLPAGSYSVERDAFGNTLRLAGTYSTKGFIWSAAASAHDSTNRVVLQFDETGQGHTLRSVQYGPVTTAQLDKKSVKTENISPRMMPGR